MGQCSSNQACNGWPKNCPKTRSDPDVAGIGYIVAFCLTSLLTIGGSIVKFILEPSAQNDKNIRPRRTNDQDASKWYHVQEGVRKTTTPASSRWSKVLTKLILGLSDQQLASSLALLITAFARRCYISNYHLDIVCDLAWFSCITHLCSVIVLRDYWGQDSRRRALAVRVVLMFSVLVLLTVAMVWSPQYDPVVGSASCPAQCTFAQGSASDLFSEVTELSHSTFLHVAGIIQTVFLFWCYSTCLMFVVGWYRKLTMMLLLDVPGFVSSIVVKGSKMLPLLMVCARFPMARSCVHQSAYYLRKVYLVIFFPLPKIALGFQIISWCSGLAWLLVDRQIPKTSVVDEEVENQWGFGQLFGVLLIGVPAMSLLETWADESKNPAIAVVPV